MLIGLSGKKRVGKDLTYSLLKGTVQMPCKGTAFADSMKKDLWENLFEPLGIYSSLEESLSEENRGLNRPLWQLWGTDVRRKLTKETLPEVAKKMSSLLESIVPATQMRGNYWALGGQEWCSRLLEKLLLAPHSVSPQYWIDLMKYSLLSEGWADTCVVVKDVRFPEEAKLIRDLGGFLVRITRPLEPDEHSYHESETALDDWQDWDFELLNYGTIEELGDQVAEMVVQLYKKELANA